MENPGPQLRLQLADGGAEIGLGHEEVVDVHSEFFGVETVKGVFGIDYRGYASCFLCFSYGVDGKGCLTGRFGAVNLDDTSAGISSYAKSHIQADGTCGNNLYLFDTLVAHFHDRAFTKALFYLVHGSL